MELKTGKANLLLFLFLLPFVSNAATLASISTDFLNLINIAAKFLTGLAVTYFFYGLGFYIQGGSGWKKDQNVQREAKQVMVHGVIGIFVIVSVWGIVSVVKSILGI